VHVVIVGQGERRLEGLVRECQAHVTSLSPAQLAAWVRAGKRADVMVVDTRGQVQLPSEVASLKRQVPGLGVVVVAATLDPALMLEAMRAGVSECVTEPLRREDLESAFARVAVQRTAAKQGQVFAFIGAKGGVGTTTMAVNVATALAGAAPGDALLVDLHLAYGDAAVFLGLEPKFSVVDALENIHRLDENFLKSLVVRAKGGPDLLAASNLGLVGSVEGPRLRRLIDFIAGQFEYTVLDCPRSDPAVLDSLESVSRIVIVANQELATVRSASRMAATLRQRYGRDRVNVVVSRYDSSAEIGRDDVERVTGGAVPYVFPSDYRTSLDALNRGRPLILKNHSRLASSLLGFARELAGLGAPTGVDESKPGLLGRLTGRR